MSAPARSCRSRPTTPPAHRMHSEWGKICRGDRRRAECGARAAAGASSRSARHRCGCWKARPAKTAASAPFAGETAIFITPGYRFRAVDLLMTNFHLPRSTLFMLVSAFSGLETMQRAYAHAIASGYRFYSYGDACLLFPRQVRRMSIANHFQLPPGQRRRRRARGELDDAAWRGANAGLHAGRHAGDGEGHALPMRCATPAPISCSATPII